MIYNSLVKKAINKFKNKQFPIFIERDEDGIYVTECPVFRGCYSQGKTMDESLKNVREVMELCLQEKENQEIAADYEPREISLHTISV